LSLTVVFRAAGHDFPGIYWYSEAGFKNCQRNAALFPLKIRNFLVIISEWLNLKFNSSLFTGKHDPQQFYFEPPDSQIFNLPVPRDIIGTQRSIK
jgi:hypothetical protein